MIRVGFTGTQRGMTDAQKARVDLMFAEFGLDAVEFHHGDCVGADEEAHDLADNHAFDIVIHPPTDDSKRAFCSGSGADWEPKPYLDRNHDIVDETTVLIACPNGPERMRSGTWATVRYARTKIYDAPGEQVIYVITPSGEIRREGR